MKGYERQDALVRRMPMIVRVDGRCFHTKTKGLEKPFSENLRLSLLGAALTVMRDSQNCNLAYHQSDEVSFLFVDYERHETEPWFGRDVQKVVSVTASIFTAAFNVRPPTWGGWTFDARAFNLPRAEVANYFLWRARDWKRNSIQMVARAHFSHRECKNKNAADLHEMLHAKGVNWADLADHWKNGSYLMEGGQMRSDIRPEYSAVAALVDCFVRGEPETRPC